MRKKNRKLSQLRAPGRVMKSIAAFIIFATCFGLPSSANHRPATKRPSAIPVSGRVVSESGVPIAAVSVRVKNSSFGTTTDASGNFNLNSVAENAVLVFSSVGYQTLEVPVNGQSVVNVTLIINAVTGEQVVVVGYGSQRKRDVTGAIGSVRGAELAKQPVQTATQALQGKVAGVQIFTSGAPNTAPTVRIRGTGSILGGADPLYVVDGIITDDIRNINTADITSLEVLKDASAATIYGVRAANGVILITTKKGRAGRMQIAYDANVGIRQVSHLINLANSQQYATYINEASVNTGNGAVLVDSSALGTSTDWFKAILRTAFEQNHNISLSGGTDRVTYFFSAGYLTDDGIVINNGYRRISLRSNNEYRIAPTLKFNTLISYSNGNTQDVNLGSAYNDAYHAAPIIPSKVNGLYGNTSAYQNVGNPVLDLENTDNRLLENRLQAVASLQFKPIKSLTLRSSYGTDLFYNNRHVYTNAFQNDSLTFITTGGNQKNPRSSLSVEDDHGYHWTWDNTATYQKSFNKSDFTILAGTTAEKVYSIGSFASRSDVPSNASLQFLNQGDPLTQTNSASGSEKTRISYLGRVNYSYDKKYLLTATFRADGSSVFRGKYAKFPAVGLGWVITDEGFMANQKIFDNLKLRASYGRLGNDVIPNEATFVIFNTGFPYVFNNTVDNTGVQSGGFVDRNLKWEITDETDIGFDFSVLKRRLTGEFDVYDKKVNNAILDVAVPAGTGRPDPLFTNIGSIENKGVELGLTWNDKVGRNINYNIGVNGAYLQNRVVGLNGGQPIFSGYVGNKGFTTLTSNGQPIGAFDLLQTEGVFHNQTELAAYVDSHGNPIMINGQLPSLGDLRYKDVNDDGKIDDNDRVFSGSYQPKFTFGLTAGVSYKQFDLSINGYGTLGAKIYNGKKEARFNQKDNLEADEAVNRWTFTNYTSNVPRAHLDALPQSDYFLESGDFARINTLTLGYTLRSSLVTKYHITSLRVYVLAQNLATFTNYSGFSPEIQTGNQLAEGIEYNAYPTTRTYTFGVNLNFNFMKNRNMRYSIRLVATIGLLLMIFGESCKKDFLKVDPLGQTTEDDAARDPNIARKLVTGVYNELYQGGFDNDVHGILFCMAGDVASDDADKGSTPADQAPEAVGFDNFTSDLNGNNFYVERLWKGHYNGVAAANNTLNVLNKSTFDHVTKRTLIGEVKFLRAFFYFDLVRLFGGVPAITTVPTTPAEGNSDVYNTRASKDSIYSIIISDLQYAADSLPLKGDPTTEIGRANKGAAQSLLAKVYLYRGDYQKAYDLTSQVIASGKYDLVADFSQNFRSKAFDNNVESVFEIETGTNTDCTAAIPFYTVAQGPRAGGLGGWSDLGFGLNTPSQDLANAFEPGDKRDSATIIFIKPDSTVLWDGFVIPARNRVENDRYNYKAYFGRKTDPYCATGNTDRLPKNVHIIRFAEVLLIHAEAALQSGHGGDAQADLNRIRTRAGLGTVAATVASVWKERRVELAMEQDRFFDIVRQGRAAMLLQALGKSFVAGKNEVFPIPQPEINLSGGRLIQNPGY